MFKGENLSVKSLNIAIVNIVDGKTLEKLKSKKIDTVIYVSIDPQLDSKLLNARFKLINMYDNFSRVSEFSFSLVCNQISQLRAKIPALFQYGGYDLTHGLEKDVFWGLLRHNAIKYQISTFKQVPHKIYDFYSRPLIIKRLALFKRLFIGTNDYYELSLPSPVVKVSPDVVAFRINEFEMLELYGDLIPSMPREKIISFQNIVRKNADEIHSELNNVFKFNIKSFIKQEKKDRITGFQKLQVLFLNHESDFLNVLFDSLFKLINHVEQYERLMKLGIKKIMVAAAENEGEGNIICQVARKYKCLSYNYMNGAKAKDGHNIHTCFDYWFMPNLATKNLILSFCNVRPEQLPVTGHLLEEKARKHKYTGTLDAFAEQLYGKKVISVFTSAAFITEQMEVMNFLHSYLTENEDYVVLIRKHPFDRRENIATHERMLILPAFNSDQLNKTLFDLFTCSSISISFSSTVSLQSSWFNILTINFEYAEFSMLPYVDNIKIRHANSVVRLGDLLNDHFLTAKSSDQNSEYPNASKNILALLASA